MKVMLLISLLLTGMLGTGWSQADETAQSSSPTPWRATVNGDTGSLAFSAEAERINLLSAGLAVSSVYDDNAFSTNSNRISNMGYMVAPTISIMEARTRVFWNFAYNPAFGWNQRMSPRSEADHNLDSTFQYRITERLTARVHENFRHSDSSFNEINTNPLLPSGNVLHQPNQSVVTPLTKQLMNVTTVDLIDQVGEGTAIGATGNFTKLNYSNTSADSREQLFNSESWSADGFYSHDISRRQSIGATYTLQKIATFGQIRQHTATQSIVLFYNISPISHLTLSFFAGPDHATVINKFFYAFGPFLVPVSQTRSSWLVDEGMTAAWQGQRTSAQLNFIHHVSDGGGLTGAVHIYSAGAGLRRQLTERWIGEIGVNYGDNNPLSHLYGNAFSSVTGTLGIDRQLGDRFSVAMRYGRAIQRYNNYGGASSYGHSANHNIGSITLAYHFSHPLGR